MRDIASDPDVRVRFEREARAIAALEHAHICPIYDVGQHDPSTTSTTRQPLAPAALEHVVERCLAKEPDERWQSAGDVGIQLEWIRNTRAASGASGPARHHRRKLVWSAAIGAATLFAIATAALLDDRND